MDVQQESNPSEWQSTNEETVHAIFRSAASQLARGRTEHQVTAELVKQGLSNEAACAIVDRLRPIVAARRQEALHEGHVRRSDAHRDAAPGNMARGAFFCVAGIVVTLVSYGAASGGGGFILAWGAIVFGFIQFAYGVWQSGQ